MSNLSTLDAFKWHWKVWKLYGLDLSKHGSIWRLPVLAFAVLVNATVLLFPASLFINCCLSQSINDFCERFFSTVTDVMCSLKFLNLYVARCKLLKMNSILDCLDKRSSTEEEIATLRLGINSTKRFFAVYIILIVCAIIASIIVISLSPEPMLLYPAWFPWDWSRSRRNFLCAVCYQLYAVILHGIQEVANDTYPQAYLCILTAQIKSLGLRIRKIGVHQEDEGYENGDLEKWQQQNYEELIACIKDHKIIIQLFGTIQQSFSSACLAQFICTCLAQCTIGVYMIYVGLDFSKLFHIAAFFSIVTMEIFILCYYGDLLCQENENLTKAIYSCNWVEQDTKFKQTLCFLLQRSQKPIVIMAGNMIPVQLPVFLKVMKTAYSAFTVLNKVI